MFFINIHYNSQECCELDETWVSIPVQNGSGLSSEELMGGNGEEIQEMYQER